MTDLNTVSLIGRLVKDAELSTAGNSAKLDFTLAFSTTSKKGNEWVDESNFIDVTVWGKQAENLARFLKKGKQIAIYDAHLKQDRWEKDGQKFSKIKVIPDPTKIQLLGGSKKESQNDAGSSESYVEDDSMPF